jgi:NAD(P)-dependent dehydrogenase (short-subunit alcohol dehydrogenase family)
MAMDDSSYAVVLGASTGVGAAIATRLADNDYDVIGFHRGGHPAEAARVPIAHMAVQDVGRDATCVEKGLATVRDLVGSHRVAVLVHSLSGAATGDALVMSPERVERTFNHLAHSFLWWAQGLSASGLLAPNAMLVALTNPLPEFYLTNSGVIGAAKAALEAYVRILAVEMGDDDVRVNGVRFSTVMTPALRKVVGESGAASLDQLHRLIVPAGRMTTAVEIAEVVARLVQTPLINGAIIDATAGATSTLLDYAFQAGAPR